MKLEESGSLSSKYTAKLQTLKSMLLEQKETYRSMDYDRSPSNKPMHLW